MENQSQENTVIQYPDDIHLYGERDFTFLGSFLILRQFVGGVEKVLGKGFEMSAAVYRDNKFSFYRSASEEIAFAQYYGDRCFKDSTYTDNLVAKLNQLTAEVDGFLKKESKLTTQNCVEFFRLFDEHFVYHLVVFWAGDHALAVGGIDNVEYKKLYAVRKTNEHVLPDIENWIRAQGDIAFMTPEEIESFLVKGEQVSVKVIEGRKKLSFLFLDKQHTFLYTGERAEEEFARLNTLISEKNKGMIHGKTEVKGIPVSSGKYTGRVRVVNDFADFVQIKEGEVLVTPMTRPHFNDSIRRAGAIITDEGAMLCHAAIVAREFKIPTIVGTKVGTFVFKDGDMVEVDAGAGIAKIV